MVGVKGQVQSRGVERRRAVVEAATELFARSGYRTTTLAGIGREIGIAPSAIVHHFGSKEQLLLAVLAYVDEQALTALGNTVPTTTTRAAFQRWVEVAHWAEGKGRTFVLLSARLEAEASSGPHPAREHFRQRDMAVRVMLAVMLHEGVGRGDLRGDFDVEAKAAEMAAFGVGAQFMWMRDPDNVSLPQLYATYFGDQYELLRQTRPRRRAAVRPSPAV